MKLIFSLILTLLIGGTLQAQLWDSKRNERPRKVFYSYEEAEKMPLRVSNLDLSKQGLLEVPEDIRQFKNLSRLDLAGNELKVLPQSIGKLGKLRELNLSNMPTLEAAELFTSIKDLSGLKKLSLEGGEFVILPHEISYLKELEEIVLRNNRFPTIPRFVTELPNLRRLDLANNKLDKMDYDIYRLQELIAIDISNNEKLDYEDAVFTLSFIFSLRELSLRGLKEIPVELNKVQQINYLDISEGTFTRIPVRINDLTSLEHLRMNNCNNINLKDALPKFGGLTQLLELEIKHDKVYLFPKGLGKFPHLRRLTLGGPLLKYASNDLRKLTKLEELKVEGSPLIEVKDLLDKTAGMTKLHTLGFKLCDFKVFPTEILALKNLENLDLSGNFLTYIPESITTMTKLKTLDLRGNQLEIREVDALRRSMPSCKILYSPKGAKAMLVNNIRPPIQHVNIPVQSRKIHGHSATSLQMPSGTKIKIPKNAFMDENGSIVTGQIEIMYREFFNPLDFFLGGIPMTVDSLGRKYDLKSEAVIELEAFHRGRPLYPNPTAPINIEILTKESDIVFDIHHYNTISGEWNKLGRDYILGKEKINPNNGPGGPFDGGFMNPKVPILPKPPSEPAVENIDVSFYFNKKKKVISFKGEYYNDEATRKSAWSTKFFQDFGDIESVSWVYDGKRWKADSKLLDTLSRVDEYLKEADRDKKILDDFCLSYGELTAKKAVDIFVTVDKAEDRFYLNFVRSLDTLRIPVIADISNDGFDNGRYEAYMTKRQKRMIDWDKVDDLYRENLKKYEQSVDKYRIELSKFSLEMGPAGGMERLDTDRTRRRVSVTSFGILSLNKLQLRSAESMMAQYIDSYGTVHQAQEVYVLDETNNRVIVNPSHRLSFDPRAKNSIIALLDNGDLGVINSGTFRRIPKSIKKGKTLLELEVLPKESLSLQRLKTVLSF